MAVKEEKKPRGSNVRNMRIAGWKQKEQEERRKTAELRQDAHDKLSTKQKIEKLDNKLGVGFGATKERARLIASL